MKNKIELKTKIRATLGLRIGVIIYLDYSGSLDDMGFNHIGNVTLLDGLTLQVWHGASDNEIVYLSRGKI